jgi:hypothetical protein
MIHEIATDKGPFLSKNDHSGGGVGRESGLNVKALTMGVPRGWQDIPFRNDKTGSNAD